MNVWGDEIVVGMSGEITSVPPGFYHDTILHVNTGVTDTVLGFGKRLQHAHNVSKKKDPIVENIGYWSECRRCACYLFYGINLTTSNWTKLITGLTITGMHTRNMWTNLEM